MDQEKIDEEMLFEASRAMHEEAVRFKAKFDVFIDKLSEAIEKIEGRRKPQ